MRIAIMGTGALGGFFGARLAAAGIDTSFIARGKVLAALRQDGIQLDSPTLGSFAAGLVIYWSWNNTLSVIQQTAIMKRAGVKIELWDNLIGMFRKKATT